MWAKDDCENNLALFIFFIFHLKIHKISTYHWSKKKLKWEENLIVK